MLQLTTRPARRAWFSRHFRRPRRSTEEAEAVVWGAAEAVEGMAAAVVEVREPAEVQEAVEERGAVEEPGAAVARAEAADREPDRREAARVERAAEAAVVIIFHLT